MRMRPTVVSVMLLSGFLPAIGTPACAHRLDEYLQATTILVEQDRIQAQTRLTPGVAVFSRVFASMDANGDGVLSQSEQKSYAERALGDMALAVDGSRLRPRLTAWKFPSVAEMKAGRGDIQLDYEAAVPRRSGSRKFVFENHHQERIAVYLVNCLVPRDPAIQVTAQKRNYLQSRYELDYTQTGARSSPPSAIVRGGNGKWLGAILLLLAAPSAWLWRRAWTGKQAPAQEKAQSVPETVSAGRQERMKSEKRPRIGLGILSVWLVLAILLSARPAQAHPLPLSYIDLRLDSKGLEASVQVPAAALARDLPALSEKSLLTPDTLQAHRQEIAALLTSRLRLDIAGKPLSPMVEGIAPIPDQKDARLSLRYNWPELPASLHIQCRLFPSDPAHQTYVDVYEAGVLKREMIFDSHNWQQDYVRGSRQSVGEVIRQFLVQGVIHIFTGPDHILFIVGLLLLGGTLKQLLKIVTAFTVAHSVTLCLATLNILNPPARIIEPTIALSIVFVGVHSMLMRKRQADGKSLPDTRLLFAFAFGFIHGFGFANALQELELPRQALAGALFSFNLGVECGAGMYRSYRCALAGFTASQKRAYRAAVRDGRLADGDRGGRLLVCAARYGRLTLIQQREKETISMELDTHAYNDYIASLFAPQDEALSETLAEMKRENVPGINVSPVEGKLLHVLALLTGAKRVLEVGTLGGYSGINLARALPEGGKLITLEIDPHHAEVARRNFERAGVAQKAEVRVGPAAESLQQMAADGEAPFDLVFIDADKDGYVEYLRLALPLLREGGLLLGDNTLPDAVLTEETSGTKRYNAAVADCPELTTIIIPILRQHGLDGLTVSIKRSAAV